MVRALAFGPVVALALVSSACGAAEPTMEGRGTKARTTTREARTTITAAGAAVPTTLRGRTFRYDDVEACIGRASTTHGHLVTGPYSYVFDQIHAGGGILGVSVAVSDYALNGAQIGFTDDGEDAAQLIDALHTLNADRLSPFAGSEIERRGNAVLFQLTDDDEIRRIIYGCLGGPPYAGDGGPPPTDDFWGEPPPPPEASTGP